ncbi:MAG: hydrogenase maturation protease [Methylococcales bacterium]|nr:hydrogenase maturation protease [Methylococcales bacterium]
MPLSPFLILGYGNRSRGDDALGGLFLDAIAPQLDNRQFEILEDFQLNIEHALDINGRQLVLLVDAALDLNAPYRFSEVKPLAELGYTSHAMSPEALLALCQRLEPATLPPVFLLAIEGRDFALGAELGATAHENLRQALHFAGLLLEIPRAAAWRAQLTP